MELLIPTLNKIISYQFLLILLEGTNHEQSSQSNESICLIPPKIWGDIFRKEVFHEGQIFGAKNVSEGYSRWEDK